MQVSPKIRFGEDKPYSFSTKRFDITSTDSPDSKEISWNQAVELGSSIMGLLGSCGDEGLKDADRPQPVRVAGLQIALGGKGEKKLTAKDIRDAKLTGVWHAVRRAFTAFFETLAIFSKKAYYLIMSAESKVSKLGQVFSSLFGGVPGTKSDTPANDNDKSGNK